MTPHASRSTVKVRVCCRERETRIFRQLSRSYIILGEGIHILLYTSHTLLIYAYKPVLFHRIQYNSILFSTTLLAKNIKWEWTEAQQNSFEILKQALCSAPVLVSVDADKPFILTTDASVKAIGAVLSQGEPGEDHPVAYMSRSLNKSEQNYSTTEKECLAVVNAVDYFSHYLYGKYLLFTEIMNLYSGLIL